MATNHGMKKREGQARRAEKLALKLALKAEKAEARKAAAQVKGAEQMAKLR